MSGPELMLYFFLKKIIDNLTVRMLRSSYFNDIRKIPKMKKITFHYPYFFTH